MNSYRFGFMGLTHSVVLIELELRRRLEPLGLQWRQSRVLDALHLAGTASQVELANTFSIKPASMSAMTERMLANGLISRRPDPNDSRRNLLTLTPKGEALIDQVHEAWREVDALVAEHLGEAQAKQLFDSAHDLRRSFGAKTPKDLHSEEQK